MLQLFAFPSCIAYLNVCKFFHIMLLQLHLPTTTGQSGGHHLLNCLTAVYLDEESRATLLRAFPPRHASVFADHVTLCYQPSAVVLSACPVGEK